MRRAFYLLAGLLLVGMSGCASRNNQVTVHAPDGSTVTGEALSDSSVDERTVQFQKRAKYYTGKIWQVKRVEKRIGIRADYEVAVTIADGNFDGTILVFQDTHRDYQKFRSLRPGDEITLEFSDIDGDPKTKSGGDILREKWLRLGTVR